VVAWHASFNNIKSGIEKRITLQVRHRAPITSPKEIFLEKTLAPRNVTRYDLYWQIFILLEMDK